ncbi:MAG: radical SAM protein [Candidatus Bathyarchaeia archaeon]
MTRVLLTADRTLMSDYRGKEFLGFGTSAPPYVLPPWLYQRLFFPPVRRRRGLPAEAPYGLRKVEARLIMDGYDVVTVDPDHLPRYIADADVLGVHTMDPFGLGPSSSTFTKILKRGDPFLARCFRAIFELTEVKIAKRRGLKILVGGPGAWQFEVRGEAFAEYGIDCALIGEAENVIGRLVGRLANGEAVPRVYRARLDETPSLDEIAEIRQPSINGLVEIGRGCPRGCAFCDTTLRPLRWYPYDKIERELAVNSEADLRGGILHGEDVLLYGSSNTTPVRERVIRLHQLAKKYMTTFCWSHTSMAAVAADKHLIGEVADIILGDSQTWWGAEIGIETGSPRLLRKVMPAKAHPFKPEEWPEVVKTAAGLMTDNKLFPACTLISGLPEESEEDVYATLDLIDDLRGFRAFIIPLFFVPLGRLKEKDWFKLEDLTDLQKELFVRCFNHDLRWAKEMMDLYFTGDRWGWLVKKAFSLFLWMLKRYVAREGVTLIPEAPPRSARAIEPPALHPLLTQHSKA